MKPSRSTNTLQAAVLKSVSLPMFMLAIVASAISIIVTTIWASAHLDEHIHELAKSSSVPVQELVWRFDNEELQVVLDNFVSSGVLVGVLVTDGGDLVVQSGTIEARDDTVSVTEPLTYDQDGQQVLIGSMTLVASKESIYALGRQRAVSLVVISSVTVLLTTLAILLLLKRQIIRPVAEIERGLIRATSGDGALTSDFHPTGEHGMIQELRAVVDAITAMRLNMLDSQQQLIDKQKQVLRAAEIAGLGYGSVNLTKMRFVECDDNLAKLMGRDIAELLAMDLNDAEMMKRFLNEDDQKRTTRLSALAKGKRVGDVFQITWKDGDTRDVRVILEPNKILSDGDVTLDLVAQDITVLRRSEERVRQAEKMQTIGKLTGGVAHDFNNILAIISGNLELINGVAADEDVTAMTATALTAVDRGARLTQQLLAFARKQPLSPVQLDPSRLIKDIQPMLGISAGPSIDLQIVSDSGLWMTIADPIQLESCVLNLVVNARDAMPNGGNLTIEVANTRIDRTYARAHDEVAPGQYVCISVADTGCGMAPHTIAKAFDPFFTTKEVGKGTGLGLSMVFGFAKQSGGHAKIYSEEGHGTIVKLYLPRAHGAVPERGEGAANALDGTPSLIGKRVLLIEDEPDLMTLYVSQLELFGCIVETARNGSEALACVGQIDIPDLILTDIILPGNMNGKQIVDKLAVHYPHTPVVFMSGFTENAIIHDGKLDVGSMMLQKPFTLVELATMLTEVLQGDVGKQS